MSLIELGPNNTVLQWERHELRAICETPELEYEPAFLQADQEMVRKRRLRGFKSDENGIFWEWVKWVKVECVLCSGDLKIGGITRNCREKSAITWNDVLFAPKTTPDVCCDSVELTPIDAEGKGVTVRVEFPALFTNDRITFDPLPDRFRVLVRLNGAVPSKLVRVRMVKHSGTGYNLKGEEIEFDNQGEREVSVSGFQGAITVVLVLGQGSRQLIALSYFDHVEPGNYLRQRQMDVEHAAKIRRVIETQTMMVAGRTSRQPSWIEQWPLESRHRLSAIYRHVLELAGSRAEELFKKNLTGVFRAVFLNRLEIPISEPFHKLATELNQGNFVTALRRLLPALPDKFEQLDTDRMLWVFQYIHDVGFEEVWKWAGHGNVAALDQARDLLGWRKHTQGQLAELQPGNEVHHRAQALAYKIQQAPFTNVSLNVLRRESGEIDVAIAADHRQPINPEGEPPVTRVRYQEWQQLVKKMIFWRRQLAQLLHYCEIGEWNLPDVAPPRAELEARLRRLHPPEALAEMLAEQAGNLALSQQVQRLVDELVEKHADEPAKSLRDQALEKMDKIIRPHAHKWEAVHAEFRQARSVVSRNPQRYAFVAPLLDEQAVNSDWAERISIVRCFLKMVEEVRTLQRSWRKTMLTTRHDDWEELLDILFNPTHERIALSYKRGQRLREFFDGFSQADGIQVPEQQPPPPPRKFIEIFTSWWQDLRALDEVLDTLGQHEKYFQQHAQEFRVHQKSRLDRFINHWSRQPLDECPVKYDEINHNYQRFCEEGQNLRPVTFERLVIVLAKNQGWDNF